MLTISILRVRSECNGYKSLIALLLMIVSKSTIIHSNERSSGYYNKKCGKEIFLFFKKKKASHLMYRHFLPVLFAGPCLKFTGTSVLDLFPQVAV